MKIKKANVKLLFKGGKLNEILFGDFGSIEIPTGGSQEKKAGQWEDCLLAWPCDPQSTGKSGIVGILGLPVTDCCFRNF